MEYKIGDVVWWGSLRGKIIDKHAIEPAYKIEFDEFIVLRPVGGIEGEEQLQKILWLPPHYLIKKTET